MQPERIDEILGLYLSAFHDYKASRFLLNNNYAMHGATIASTCIEKYLKCVLLTHGIKRKFHLDKIDIFKSDLEKIGYKVIFDKLDPVFLDILQKVYLYRYRDTKTVTKADTVGFLINQFLCELDYSVWFLNQAIKLKKVDDNLFEPIFYREMKSDNPDLLKNNYISEKVDKKEFMERPSDAYAIHISPKFIGEELEIKGTNIKVPYTGNIWTIKVTNDQ